MKDLRQRNDSSKSQREDANPNQFEFSPNSTKLNQTPKQNKHSFFIEGEHSSDKKSANDDSQEYEMLSRDAIEQDRKKVYDLMVSLLHKNQHINLEDKATMIQLLQNKIMRTQMTEILNEINSPKQIYN